MDLSGSKPVPAVRSGLAGPLVRYVVSAGLVRTADGGAAVGLVLLANEHGGHSALGGGLAACLTFPHLAGPVLARRLDQAGDGRRLLAGCYLLYALALGAATVSLGKLPLIAVFVLVGVAGLCGPMLTGGMSSGLAGLISDPAGLRRAQGWDAITYGLGGSAGPAAVAAVAAVTNPRVALGVLVTAAVAAAAITLTLPRPRTDTDASAPAMPFRQVLGTLAHNPGLRRVTVTTTVMALVGGANVVLAVGLALRLGAGSNAGAILVALFGGGNLAGSAAVTARPLRGQADRLLARFALAIGAAFALAGLAPAFVWAAAAFAIAGFLNGPFFAATLAARSDYSPEGANAQIFVTMAALKVGAQSLGTAAAGLFGSSGSRWGLIGGGVLVVLVVAILILDRQRQPATTAQ